MSIRTLSCVLASAVLMAFGFASANAQQPQKPQPPPSLRLYVLDCGIIVPANVDAYGLKVSEVADTRMITPCFLVVHPRGSLMWDTGEIPDSAFKDGVSPQKLNAFVGRSPAAPATRCDRLHSGRHHLSRALPLPWRSRRQRQPIRQFELDRAEGRPGPDPGAAAGQPAGTAACRTRNFLMASPTAKRLC